MEETNFSGTATPYTQIGDQKIYRAPNGREYPVIEYRRHEWSEVVVGAGYVPFTRRGWCPEVRATRVCSLCSSGQAHLCFGYQWEIDNARGKPNQ
jgi:hypothetical protein